MADSKQSFPSTRTVALLTASVGVGFLCVIFQHRAKILERIRYACDFRNPLRHRQIEIVESADACHRVVSTLKNHCSDYQVLGFDCEWVTVGGTQRPTALLQLCSNKGLCGLFRLCCLQQIPISLRELLEDEEIIKVGVVPQDDASHLYRDFGVQVASTLDLRFVAEMTGHKSGGLAKLAKAHLGIHLDKNWRLVCSDWEAKLLTEKQIEYAANDAMVAVEIFKKLSRELDSRKFWQSSNITSLARVKERCEPFLDVRFNVGFPTNVGKKSRKKQSLLRAEKTSAWQSKKTNTRGISTRSKTLYDNCLLQAPDGELLCTIDRKKAQWYIDQSLGEQVSSDPFTVRLNFEPAGRPVGEVGRYYQTPKENHCVVCGHKDAYIRKNIVPREYRTHFPVVMKSHTSHDVLLLCPRCHQLSNISDLKIRTKLAKISDAPFTHEEGGAKIIEIPELRQLKSAARALLYSSDKIPDKRKNELRKIVLNHYPEASDVTEALLENAVNVDTIKNVEGYCPHGLRVVQYYQTERGGLIELERLWREHFLKTMQPKFLPTLWNVNHNANRLEIRANEGRIEKDDLILAGLDPSVLVEVSAPDTSKEL